jgi:gamma-glutamylcyclotransferase (GGCT)/AIG2-like uncharacterized protein YtfP
MPLPYLAYGSNLLTTRLSARCPSARVIGVARLSGHGLDFSKYGRDGTGKATITAGKGDIAGVLYDIAAQDIPALDSAEGAGTHYAKVEVTLADGRAAFTYSALVRAGGLVPLCMVSCADPRGAARTWAGATRSGPDHRPARPATGSRDIPARTRCT